MNEGEKDKGCKKRGDSVTFRLLKKLQYSDKVIELMNNSRGKCNEEIIKALDFYVKYKHRKKEIELYIQFIDTINNPEEFSEKVIKKLYSEFISQKIYTKEDRNDSEDIKALELKNKANDTKEYAIESENENFEEKETNKVINIGQRNTEDNSEEEDELFGGIGRDKNEVKSKPASISRAISSIRRQR